MQKLANFVRRSDLFAIPVQLTYKGQRKFDTFLGGCCTILLVIAALTTLPLMILDGMYNPDYTQTKLNNRLGLLYHSTFEIDTASNFIAARLFSFRDLDLNPEEYARVVFYIDEETVFKAIPCS